MVANKLDATRLGQAATIVRQGVDETLSYMGFRREHWNRIRTNNVLERIMREIRRRTRVVGNFPDGKSAVMLPRRSAASHRRHALGQARLSRHRSIARSARNTTRFRKRAPPGGKSNGTLRVNEALPPRETFG